MLKKLVQLANDLDKRGLIREADFIDRLIEKVAVPNILFYSDDESKSKHSDSSSIKFNSENDNLSEWQSWMKNLVTPIAIFSFDSDKLSSEDIKSIGESFGRNDEVNFEEGDYDIAIQPFSMFSNSKWPDAINIEEFCLNFPDFSKKLKQRLSSINLDAKDIVVFLYNKKNIQVGQTIFGRTPSYFMHDIFHFFEEREPEFSKKFISLFERFLSFALSYYKDAAENDASEFASRAYVKFFSGLYSLETDAKADLFSIATKGELEKSLIIPDKISFSGFNFVLIDGGKQKIEEEFKNLCSSIYSMISNKETDPLAKYKGKVLLHDFVP